MQMIMQEGRKPTFHRMFCTRQQQAAVSPEEDDRPPTRRSSLVALLASALGSRSGTGLPEGCAIRALNERAITITQLRKLFALASHRCAEEGWVAADPGASVRWTRKLTPATLTHADVLQHLVAPSTEQRRCSFVELLAIAPQPAQWYAIHWCGQTLEATIACLSQHARDHALGEDTRYWMSTYALCAHADVEPSTRELLANAMPAVMAKAAGALAVLDMRGEALTRASVGWEIALSATAPGGSTRLFEAYCASDERSDESGGLMALGMTDGLAAVDAGRIADKMARERDYPSAHLQRALAFDLRFATGSSSEEHAELLALVGDGAQAERLNATVGARMALLRLPHLLAECRPGGKPGKTRVTTSSGTPSAAVSETPVARSALRRSLGLKATDSALTTLPTTPVARVDRFAPEGGARTRRGSTEEMLATSLRTLGASSLERVRILCDPSLFHHAQFAHVEMLLPPCLASIIASHLPIDMALQLAQLLLAGDESALREVHLTHCRLHNTQVAAMAASLPGNTRLHALCLAGNRIGDEGVSALARALSDDAQRCALRELDLAANVFREEALIALADALRLPCCPLQVLCVSTTAAGTSRDGLAELWDALGGNDQLLSLDLTGWKLGDVGARRAAHMLTQNRTLRVLRLAKHGISHTGSRELATALSSNRTLRELDLAENPLADRGSLFLAAVLGRNESALQRLVLRACQLSDVGARSMADALEHNMSLALLDLSRNACTSAGADALLRAARFNNVLTELNVLDNEHVSTSMLRSVQTPADGALAVGGGRESGGVMKGIFESVGARLKRG